MTAASFVISLEFFQSDLKTLGACVDWRRSFITTDVNQFYDSFVRWHFETLRKLGKIEFGTRYTIWSPKDGQPCADHERSSGENVMPQDYTLIKMKVTELRGKLSVLQEKQLPVYLVPATMRPETMYGQTNCWVLPSGEYGAFEIATAAHQREIIICEAHSARNLSYQGYSAEWEVQGTVHHLLTVTGSELVGLCLEAPLSIYGKVYVLPMSSISMEKGTGVVTSVPSDSPDDFINFHQLKSKPTWREKLEIKDEWVLPFDPVPIIQTPLGNLTAKECCEAFNVAGANDRENLNKAKDKAYKQGFNFGKMMVGEFTGRPVAEAKPLIREQLIKSGLALPYSEPDGLVMSRSGDVCVVSLTSQWYISYGEEQWREKTKEAVDQLEVFPPEAKNLFYRTLEWLNQWACSRTYGLGTRLPWDPQYLIESLSDSTIYMAFYTVVHLLQGDALDGSQKGPFNIRPEDMTNQVWDYIFLGKEFPTSEIPEEHLKRMRREFEYWYPVDLRVSGKDLIPNHLTFFLYNHTAIFPKQLPVSIRANGHILLNNLKMAKSSGNFLTLLEGVEKYSADGLRFTLADAGDSIDDANFSGNNANKAILRLYTEIKFVEEIMDLCKSKQLIEGPPDRIYDRFFINDINIAIEQTKKHYEKTNFRDALVSGFFGMQNARDLYRERLGKDLKKINTSLILRWAEVQALLMMPITPHWSEKIWKLLGKEGFLVRDGRFPLADSIDPLLTLASSHVENSLKEFRSKFEFAKSKNKRSPLTKATIWVASSYPSWRSAVIDVIREKFDVILSDFFFIL